MKLELLINSKKTMFHTGFISGMIFRNAIQIQKRVQNDGLEIELLDDLVAFVVNVFGSQFTIDQFYEGVEATKIFDTIMDIILFCINGSMPADTQ